MSLSCTEHGAATSYEALYTTRKGLKGLTACLSAPSNPHPSGHALRPFRVAPRVTAPWYTLERDIFFDTHNLPPPPFSFLSSSSSHHHPHPSSLKRSHSEHHHHSKTPHHHSSSSSHHHHHRPSSSRDSHHSSSSRRDQPKQASSVTKSHRQKEKFKDFVEQRNLKLQKARE